MKKLIKSVVLAAVLGTSSVALAMEGGDVHADHPSVHNTMHGIYLGVDSGVSFSTGASGNVDSRVGTGYILGGRVGYRFHKNFRADVTVAYRGSYSVDKNTGVYNGGANTNAKADLASTSYMINGYYDFAHFRHFVPYVGIGIGISSNKLDRVNLTNTTTGAVLGTVEGSTRSSFAWQATLGTAVHVVKGVMFDVGLRYMDMGKFESKFSGFNGFTNVKGRGNLHAVEAQAGLRFKI